MGGSLVGLGPKFYQFFGGFPNKQKRNRHNNNNNSNLNLNDFNIASAIIQVSQAAFT